MPEPTAPYHASPDAPPFTPSPIRYRVWDGERMYKAYGLRWAGDEVVAALVSREEVHAEVGVTRKFSEWITGDLVALLSTGLYDAEGREIFDGDLLRTGATRGTVALWCACWHVVVNGEREPLYSWDLDMADVVGHVYEGLHAEG